MRPRHTALLVVAATGVDQHVEAIDVEQIGSNLDAEDRSLGAHGEFFAPVPGFHRRQILAGHARHGELHGHPALSFADALDFKLAQVLPHKRFSVVFSSILSYLRSMADLAQGFDYVVVGGG